MAANRCVESVISATNPMLCARWGEGGGHAQHVAQGVHVSFGRESNSCGGQLGQMHASRASLGAPSLAAAHPPRPPSVRLLHAPAGQQNQRAVAASMRTAAAVAGPPTAAAWARGTAPHTARAWPPRSMHSAAPCVSTHLVSPRRQRIHGFRRGRGGGRLLLAAGGGGAVRTATCATLTLGHGGAALNGALLLGGSGCARACSKRCCRPLGALHAATEGPTWVGGQQSAVCSHHSQTRHVISRAKRARTQRKTQRAHIAYAVCAQRENTTRTPREYTMQTPRKHRTRQARSTSPSFPLGGPCLHGLQAWALRSRDGGGSGTGGWRRGGAAGHGRVGGRAHSLRASIRVDRGATVPGTYQGGRAARQPALSPAAAERWALPESPRWPRGPAPTPTPRGFESAAGVPTGAPPGNARAPAGQGRTGPGATRAAGRTLVHPRVVLRANPAVPEINPPCAKRMKRGGGGGARRGWRASEPTPRWRPRQAQGGARTTHAVSGLVQLTRPHIRA